MALLGRRQPFKPIIIKGLPVSAIQPPVGRVVQAKGRFAAEAAAQRLFHPPTLAKAWRGLPYIPQKPVGKIVQAKGRFAAHEQVYLVNYHPLPHSGARVPRVRPSGPISNTHSGPFAVAGTSSTSSVGSVTAGNLLVVVVAIPGGGGAASVTGVSDDLGNTYTAGSTATSSGGGKVVYYYSVLTTGGACQVTVTTDSLTASGQAVYSEYHTNSGTWSRDDDSTGNDGGSASGTATVAMPGLNSSSSELAIAAAVCDGMATLHAPGGSWANRHPGIPDTYDYADETLATAGDPSWSLTSSSTWAAVAAAFKTDGQLDWGPFGRRNPGLPIFDHILGFLVLNPPQWMGRRHDEWCPVEEERRPRHLDALWPSNVLPPLIQDSSSTLATGASTTNACSFNYDTLPGSAVIVMVTAGSVGIVTDDKGNVYRLAVSTAQSPVCTVAIYYCINALPGARTITVRFGAATASAMALAEVAGLVALDKINNLHGLLHFPTTGAVAPNEQNEVAFAVLGVAQPAIPAAPLNWHGIAGANYNGVSNAAQFSYFLAGNITSFTATWAATATPPFGAAIATFTTFTWFPFPKRVMPPPPEPEPQTPKKVSAALLPGFSYASPWQPFAQRIMEGPPLPEPPPTRRISPALLAGFNPPVPSAWLPRRRPAPGPAPEPLPPVRAILNAFLLSGYGGPALPPEPWFPMSSKFRPPLPEPVVSQGLTEPAKRVLSAALIPVFLSGNPTLVLSPAIVPRLPHGEDNSRRLGRITEVVAQILNSLIRRGQLSMDNKGNWLIQTISNVAALLPQQSPPKNLPPLGQIWMDATGALHFLAPTGVDQLIDVGQPLGAFVVRTPTQSIADSTTTAISWDNPPTRDDNSFWSAAFPTRVTARIAGWYVVTEHVKWASNTTGKRVIDIRVNGTVYNGSNSIGPTAGEPDPDQTTSALLYLAVGDYVETTVYQNSTGNLNVTAAQLQISQLV